MALHPEVAAYRAARAAAGAAAFRRARFGRSDGPAGCDVAAAPTGTAADDG
ncbi:hypothetical protein AB0B57_29035 [Micromonospora sp. NPDC049101]|uniref:hypothetical protein n=1 Tax=unclassified Micromonospora TaxID=2617518 RepID=UPI0034105B41